MDFGLGLVLSFTDNASAGINNAVNSLSQLTLVAEGASQSLSDMASLSALSVVSDKLGSMFLKAGNSIVGTFSNIVTGIQQTGTEFQSFRITLNAMLKDEEKAEDSLKKLMNFAATTPFEITDLTGIFTTITANGLDAFQQLTGATTGFQTSLIGAIGDLMAFRPDVPAERWGVAIRNAFSGEVRSLKSALDINVEDMLGRKWGESGDIAQDFMDLADAIGVAGMMGNNFENNMNIQMANMSDIITKIKLAIADTGVFDMMIQSIRNVSGALQRIEGDRLTAFAESVGDTLKFLLKPMVKFSEVISNLIDKVVDFVGTHKRMTKVLSIFVALAGASLLLIGALLKLTSAFSGITLLFLASGKSFGGFVKLFKVGIKNILSALLPLTLALGAIYLIWKSDFAGIRTLITSFADDLFETIKIIVDAWDFELSEENYLKAKEMGILPLIEAILDLKYRFDFFKQGFIAGWKEIGSKVETAVKGFLDGIKGTPFEGLVNNLTTFLQKLASGDTQAWYDFGKSFADFTANALLFYGVIKMIGGLSKFLLPIVNLVLAFKKLGIGGMLTKLILKLGKVGKEIINIGGAMKGLQGVGFFSKLVEALRGVETLKAGKNVLNLSNALKIVFGTAQTITAGITALITGIATFIVGFVKQLKDGFSWFWEIIKWVGIALGVVGAIILGVAAWPAVIVGAIVGLVTTIIVLLKDNWTAVCDFFSRMGEWINNNVIKPVANFFVNLWNGIKTGAKAVADFFVNVWKAIVSGVKAVGNFFASIGSWIYNNIISPVVGFFTTYIFPIIAKIVEIISKIIEIIVVLVTQVVKQLVTVVKNFIQSVMNVISSILSWINTNIIQPIVNFFVGLWNTIVAGVTAFVESVKAVISVITNWINTYIITPVANFFKGLWEGIVIGVTAFIESVKTVFSAIVNWIKTKIIDPIASFFSSLWEGIKTAFGVIADTISSVLKGAVNNVLSFICGVINAVIKGINWAIDVINAIPGVNITKIELLEIPKLAQGGIVDKPTMSVIGEAGTEAVMPLENNTGWIGKLASMITSEMSNNMTPTNSGSVITNNQGNSNHKYLTNNSSTNTTYEGNTDNSVVFNEGAIQIVVQNASEEEARRMAVVIMEYIKRQRELDRMVNYA